MSVRTRRLTTADRGEWLRFRQILWPEASEARHLSQMDVLLGSSSTVVIGAFADASLLVGFAEARLRNDHVNGCVTSPVAFLEGIFVDQASRRQGVARLLMETVEAWARGTGCAELASDADIANAASHRLHQGLGFAETERVIFYRKLLMSTSSAT